MRQPRTVLLKRAVAGGLFAMVAVALSGCQPYAIKNPASPYSIVPVGSVIVLHRNVTIPAGRTRAYFQRGALVDYTDDYVPQCQLEVSRLLQVPQTVRPGRFVVTKIAEEVRNVADVDRFRFVLTRGDNGGGGPSLEMVARKLWLHSDKQPDVMWLLCGGAFDMPFRAQPPGVDVIRRTLGAFATVELSH